MSADHDNWWSAVTRVAAALAAIEPNGPIAMVERGKAGKSIDPSRMR